MEKIYDVIIVGAGYAGLTAALALKKVGKSILVLEARDRVGGRVQLMPLRAQQGPHFLPRPARGPRAVRHHECRHLFSAWME